MEERKVVHKVNSTPPSLMYGHTITPLSIITAYQDTEDWLFSNYIQLCAPKKIRKYGHTDVEFLNFYPKYFSDMDSFYLKSYNLVENILELTPDNIIEYFVKWLGCGYYIQAFLDDGDLPGTREYQSGEHFLNEHLIYGYSLDEEMFYIIGFDERDNLSKMTLSFPDLIRIFFSDISKKLVRESEWMSVGNEYGLMLYKFQNDIKFPFSILNIINQIEDYVSGRNSALNLMWLNAEKVDFVFGLNVYTALKDWVLLKDDYIDHRSFCGLYDHKVMMKNRIQCLQEKGFIKDCSIYSEYDNVIKHCEKIKFMVLKYNYYHCDGDHIKIADRLGEVRAMEEPILRKLIKELKNQ